MTIQHVIRINNQVHTITSQPAANTYILNSGKRYAVAHLASGKLVHKHCLTGRFRSTTIK